jgi:murein DD-endopeptidase MepM/ murein hydrolase activator NlpD
MPQAQDATPSAIPTPPPRPVPTYSLAGDGFVLEVYFPSLRQGEAGLLRVTGEGISQVQALFMGNDFPLYASAEGWYGFIVADIDARARDYPFSLLVLGADGQARSFEARLNVTSADYIRQNFTVPSERAFLISPEIERNEYARLQAHMSATSQTALWDVTGFQAPLNSPISARFGDFRILNQSVQTRHTGTDNSAPVGTPVQAMAGGTVAFTGMLDIRGNYVLIDHGWGIFSGYAHFSQVNVQVGDSVSVGQIIGASGNTGRSSGPHLHWELAIGGEWVDGQSFLQTWLPR